ncbi:MAG: Mur ligase domain-containing protein, partial [Patescibacteria group bacterium]
MNPVVSSKVVFCSGIGGAGVSALARLLKLQGKQVMGSDAGENMMTADLRNEGLTVFVPQAAEHIPPECDLFIFSDAVPADSPERVAAKERNLPSYSYFEALGFFFEQYKIRVAISGTHGKTTT